MGEYLFTLAVRQRVGIGYREILVIGSQIREDEVDVRFKVFEYEQPPQVSMLGGLVQIKTTENTTSQDPQAVADYQRQFHQRIKDGVVLATEIVQRGIMQR